MGKSASKNKIKTVTLIMRSLVVRVIYNAGGFEVYDYDVNVNPQMLIGT